MEGEKIEEGLLFIDEIIDLLLLNELGKLEGKAKDRAGSEYRIDAFWDGKNERYVIYLGME